MKSIISKGIAAVSLMGSLAAASEKDGEVSRATRERFLASAIVNLGHEVPSPEELRAGHPHDAGYENGGLVHCVSSPRSLSGTNPKFNCYLAGNDPRAYILPDGGLKTMKLGKREAVEGDFYDRQGRLHQRLYLDLDRGRFLDRAGAERTDIKPRQIKVKYNDKNTLEYQPHWSENDLRAAIAANITPPLRKARDPYTEVAATRLFWALGYPVDRSDGTEAVICYGCDGRNLVAIDAMIDNYYPGVRLFAKGKNAEQGWSTKEIKTGAYQGWTPQRRSYFDGLVILGALIHHKSNRARQNNLICSRWENGHCSESATMLIHDLGSVFGATHAKGRIEAWKRTDVWAKEDPGNCAVGLKWKDGGGNVEVSDGGRQFILDKFAALTDEHLRAIFLGAKFQRVDGQLRVKTYEALFPESMWKRETRGIDDDVDAVFSGGSGDTSLEKVHRVLEKLEAKLTPDEVERLDRAVVDAWIKVLRSRVRQLETKRCET